MLRNEVQTTNHWLGVTLVGRKNRDVVGAKLTLDVAGRRLTRLTQKSQQGLSPAEHSIEHRPAELLESNLMGSRPSGLS